jgi:hypothetical protein
VLLQSLAVVDRVEWSVWNEMSGVELCPDWFGWKWGGLYMHQALQKWKEVLGAEMGKVFVIW